jgi:hypothetical protein
MTDEELRDLLAEIRNELDRTDTDDNRERAILGELISDIQELLDRPKKDPIQADEPIPAWLGAAIEDRITTQRSPAHSRIYWPRSAMWEFRYAVWLTPDSVRLTDPGASSRLTSAA